jgi:hypothetical protein
MEKPRQKAIEDHSDQTNKQHWPHEAKILFTRARVNRQTKKYKQGQSTSLKDQNALPPRGIRGRDNADGVRFY